MTIPAQRLHPACDNISDFGQCPESGLDEMDAVAIIRSARGLQDAISEHQLFADHGSFVTAVEKKLSLMVPTDRCNS